MAKQLLNIGSSANDGTGDTIRVGGDKINDNFKYFVSINEVCKKRVKIIFKKTFVFV